MLPAGVKVMKKELKMDKCREEFELWLNEYAGSEIDFSVYRGKTPSGEDGYLLKTQDATALVTSSWQAWKASRESMKAIKLPPDFNTMRISTTAKNKIIRSITSAGYKVE